MKIDQREKLIESVGIETADIIQELQDEIAALHEYLNVVKMFGTKGFKLLESAEPYSKKVD